MGIVSVGKQGHKCWGSSSKGKGRKLGLKENKTLQKAIVGIPRKLFASSVSEILYS